MKLKIGLWLILADGNLAIKVGVSEATLQVLDFSSSKITFLG